MVTTCRHCARAIVQDEDGYWVDPEATGDDSIWRETCDEHDTFVANHEPAPHRVCGRCQGDATKRRTMRDHMDSCHESLTCRVCGRVDVVPTRSGLYCYASDDDDHREREYELGQARRPHRSV